jgi:hypothetical protein
MKKVLSMLLLAALASAITGVPLEAQRRVDENDRRVYIVNARSSPMTRLYAAPSTASGWKGNILIQPIPPGRKTLIDFEDGTGACQFDFRAVFKDRQIVQMWSINVCRESEWVAAD